MYYKGYNREIFLGCHIFLEQKTSRSSSLYRKIRNENIKKNKDEMEFYWTK